MTKKDLVRIIREVVRKEVRQQIGNVLTEMEHKKAQEDKSMSLNEALNQTDPFPTMQGKTFTSADARAQFASMQNGFNPSSQPQTDLSGKPVNVNQLGGGLDKALTRDYSELVKRFNK